MYSIIEISDNAKIEIEQIHDRVYFDLIFDDRVDAVSFTKAETLRVISALEEAIRGL